MRIFGGSESEVHPKRDKCSWFRRIKPVRTPSVKRTSMTESFVELEGERRAMYRTVVGKLLHMCQERADVVYSMKETARKITYPTESDEVNFSQCLKRRSKCKELDRKHYTFKVRERVCRQRWAGQVTTCKSTSGGVVQWGNATLTAWSRTQ